MMRFLMTYAIGLIFGYGIILGGMANPAKVLNFFDIVGTWDPSLAFVMGCALGITALGYRFVLRRVWSMCSTCQRSDPLMRH
jgi:uncharacterized membrane protein YedE/YeeE